MSLSRAQCRCLCCAVFVVLVTGSVLLGVSFSVLEPNEVGIEYNGNTLSVNSKELFTSGRHFLGVGHSFIVYPRTAQTVKFSPPPSNGPAIQARTRDGLSLNLEVSFNYRLVLTLESLLDVYYLFGGSVATSQAYERIARNTIREVSSNFRAFSFFENRTVIEASMQTQLQSRLQAYGAELDSLQLLQISLPSRFEEARNAQETALQQIRQAENQRSVARVQAATDVARAREEAQVIVLDAAAEAARTGLDLATAVQALSRRVGVEQESFLAIKTALQLDDKQLLAYIWNEVVLKHQTSEMVLSVQRPGELMH